jgi:hypothetical protein
MASSILALLATKWACSPWSVPKHSILTPDSGYNPNNPDDYNGPGAYYPVTPSGHIVCLVAKGGYELETTEFDDDQSPYNPKRFAAGRQQWHLN